MKRISQFTLPGDLDIDVLFEKGQLAYTFNFQDKTYGNKVTLNSRKVEDIVAATFVLFSNALETKAALEKPQ